MTQSIILCIDRDDDVGVKTGYRGPLIGRKENLDAAIALAIKDPENADANTMFAAISEYDRHREEGEDIEIVTITGDPHVGKISDKTISLQLEDVLKRLQPEFAIIVSDGEEDEQVIPIISSRLKINWVRRVYIRQSPTIESTYYFVSRALKDVKLRSKIITPIALILLIWGLLSAIPLMISIQEGNWSVVYLNPNLATIIIPLVIGTYLLFWVYDVIGVISQSASEFLIELRRGNLKPFFYLFSIFFVIYGFVNGYVSAAQSGTNDVITKILYFIGGSLFLWIFAVWFRELGTIASFAIQKKKVPSSFWIITIFLVAFALLILSMIQIIGLKLGIGEKDIWVILLTAAFGIAIIILGVVISQYLRIIERRKLQESTKVEKATIK